MKKVMIFVMLLLSTSMAMAQFGDLDEIIRKAESGNSGNGSTNTPSGTDKPNRNSPSMILSLIDDAIKDGFYLVKQEYRLEDVNVPGSRYNREGQDCFNSTVSFMLKLKNGIVTSEKVMAPWESDEEFDAYKGGQYVPHISRTSYLRVGQKEWKVSDKMFDPENMKSESINKGQGMAYVKNEESGEGFMIARGAGKKEGFIIWLSFSENKDEVNARYSVSSVEINLEKGKKCTVSAKSRPNDANFGIVVEPLYSIGRIELTLVGVIDLNYNALSEGDGSESTCQVELLRSLVGNNNPTVGESSDLKPSGDAKTEEDNNKEGKKSKKN